MIDIVKYHDHPLLITSSSVSTWIIAKPMDWIVTNTRHARLNSGYLHNTVEQKRGVPFLLFTLLETWSPYIWQNIFTISTTQFPSLNSFFQSILFFRRINTNFETILKDIQFKYFKSCQLASSFATIISLSIKHFPIQSKRLT